MVESLQKQRCEHCKAGQVSVNMRTGESASFCHVCGLPPLYKVGSVTRRRSHLRYQYYILGIPQVHGQWEIGRKRPGAVGRSKPSGAPQKAPRSLLESGVPSVTWYLGSTSVKSAGYLVRGTLDGSWRVYHGRLWHKKRFRRRRTDSDSQKELGTESEEWRTTMQEDPDAFLDAALEDPALMKRLFPALWRQRIGDDGDTRETVLQDPSDIMESMDPEDLREAFPDLWKKRYGKKQAIESDSYWDNKSEIDANEK